MNIELLNGYFIEVADECNTLKQRYTGKTKKGEEKTCEKFIGYFPKIEDAIERFLKHYQSDILGNLSMDYKTYAEKISIVNKWAVKEIKELLDGGKE